MRQFLFLFFPVCFLFGAASGWAQEAPDAKNDWYFGRNILSAVWQVTGVGNGPGLELERTFINTNKFTYLLALSYQASEAEIGNDWNSIYFPLENITKEPTYLVLFRPGVRWYPFGLNGRFRYALGFNLWLGKGTGQGTTIYADNKNRVEPRTMLGATFNQALHLHLTPHVRFSLEAGLGVGKDTRKGFPQNQRLLNGTYFRNISCALGFRW